MQGPLGSAQTEQWSWILQTVWGWVWGGLSWIVDWQSQVFRLVTTGSSLWEAIWIIIVADVTMSLDNSSGYELHSDASAHVYWRTRAAQLVDS